MSVNEFTGHEARRGHLRQSGLNTFSRREALLARRNAKFLKHLQSAQVALSRGALDEALEAAEQAGLLEPDDARVIAVLEKAQGFAHPSTVIWMRDGERPRTRAGPIGPASWSFSTPSIRSPRRATRAASAFISLAGHGLAAVVTFFALTRVLPVVAT